MMSSFNPRRRNNNSSPIRNASDPLKTSSPSKQRYLHPNHHRNTNSIISTIRAQIAKHSMILAKSSVVLFALAAIFLLDFYPDNIILRKTYDNTNITVFKRVPTKQNKKQKKPTKYQEASAKAPPRVVMLMPMDDATSLLPTITTTTIIPQHGQIVRLDGNEKKTSHKKTSYNTRKPQFPINVLEPNECEPFSSWQSEYHPTCTQFHEIDFIYLSDSENIELVGIKGSWRHAWRLSSSFEEVALKTLKFQHDYDPLYYEYHRVDAVAMEHLSASPYVMNIYSLCGNNVITEYASQSLVKYLHHHNNPFARLLSARDVARGMVHIHYSDSDNVTLVHNDVNAANIMMSGSTPKFNDFNIGILMMWNKVYHRPCRFQCDMDNAQWRSPEEMKQENGENSKEPLTEKTDIYALGGVFFKILTGRDPWLEYYDKGTKTMDGNKLEEAKRHGKMPLFPAGLLGKKKKAPLRSIYEAMVKCFQLAPQDRPTAQELLIDLEEQVDLLLEEIRRKKANSNRTSNGSIGDSL